MVGVALFFVTNVARADVSPCGCEVPGHRVTSGAAPSPRCSPSAASRCSSSSVVAAPGLAHAGMTAGALEVAAYGESAERRVM